MSLPGALARQESAGLKLHQTPSVILRNGRNRSTCRYFRTPPTPCLHAEVSPVPSSEPIPTGFSGCSSPAGACHRGLFASCLAAACDLDDLHMQSTDVAKLRVLGASRALSHGSNIKNPKPQRHENTTWTGHQLLPLLLRMWPFPEVLVVFLPRPLRLQDLARVWFGSVLQAA